MSVNLSKSEIAKRKAQSNRDKANAKRGVVARAGSKPKGAAPLVREVEMGIFTWTAAESQSLSGTVELAGTDMRSSQKTKVDIRGFEWTLESVHVRVEKTLRVEPYKWVARACLLQAAGSGTPLPSVAEKVTGGRKVAGTGDGGNVLIPLPFRKGDQRTETADDVLRVYVSVELAGPSEEIGKDKDDKPIHSSLIRTVLVGKYSYRVGGTIL